MRRATDNGASRLELTLRGVAFLLLAGALYYLVSLLDEHVLRPTAAVFGWLLSLLGQQHEVDGAFIRGGAQNFEIVGECTAVLPTVLLVSAIACYPAPWRSRVVGVLIGVPAVLLVNQLRLLTLWFVHGHAVDAFELVHVYLWQPLMVVLVLVLFVLWLERLAPRRAAATG